MAKSEHRITVNASKNEVFEAITTLNGLKGWYSPAVSGKSGKGGEISLTFSEKDGPFRWSVTEAQEGSLVRWECVSGPGQSAGTVATFHLSGSGDRTTVDFEHEGFQEWDEKLKTCNTLWGALMHQLKHFVETSKPEPAFR